MSTNVAEEQTAPLCPGREAFLKASDLDPASFRRIVVRRARKIIGEPVAYVTEEQERRDLEELMQEKLHREVDFLPARFLRDGAERARAVCRISTRSSLGTGFMIGNGILMTNNHVLGNREEATGAVAEFGFEAGSELIQAPIQPDRLFITDARLDFTIVAFEASNLQEVQPIRLTRNPATVTRSERVNIIQHPRGRQKEVALHDNRVERILDDVIRYRTDTEPGSSGSCVLNNDWELVALHHAGESFDDGTALNEGIRVSSIVSHLLQARRESASNREGLNEILAGVTDSSPYLGIFDAEGVADDQGQEVQVADFQGSRDFADVGVWNIEHFNDRIDRQRVETVADVVSRLGLDVFGLTEVQRGALDRLVASLVQRGFDTDFVLEDAPNSQDLAILYDRDTTTVEELRLSSAHQRLLNTRTSTGRTVFPRHPLFAHCHVQAEDGRSAEFVMIVVHLKAFGDASSRERRREAAKVLAKIIDDLRNTDEMPVVLGGDFNERLDTDVLRALKDSPDLVKMTADDATNGALSFVGPSHRSLIDHLIVTSDVSTGDIMGDDAAIVRLDQRIGDFADTVSDHVPIVFRMVLRPRPVVVEPVVDELGRTSLTIPRGARELLVEFENGRERQESTATANEGRRARTPKRRRATQKA